ncbi:related to 26S proteasome subunit RPN4 [Rhynchosporium secalis]|uniref:Related to 26S proteasome subunit RPN4 n=1 Tax=Rhynchosporium secalis TaxID=38038 RepID=A0A1E1MAR9_RHYSE|nr:related to 26S proteasome subunit RPN4 [Rhynchosporium secalis]
MLLVLPNHRRQLYSQSIINIPSQQQQQQQQQDHLPGSATSAAAAAATLANTSFSASGLHISTPQPHYYNNTTSSILCSLEQDQPLFDYQTQQQVPSSQSHPLMQSEHSNNSWLENGQLTPRSTTRAHHRESSLSSLGSAGPSSPYTANISNPQVVGDIYHEFNNYHHNSSKPLTPAHTPSQEHFLTPHYSSFYHNPAFTMSNDGLPKPIASSEMMAAPEFNHSGRPSTLSTGAHDSPSTSPLYEEDREKNGEVSRFDISLSVYLQHCDDLAYRNPVPKLDRTMTDVYNDELYNPNFTSAPSSTPAPAVILPPQDDVFSQRLQAANSQHLSANIQTPLTIPSRERSPFRQGSPLAPTGNSFGQQSPNVRFGTAQHLRQQQKAESDARALQQQLDRASSEHSTPKTISPKEVDLVYHENEEDADTPLFPAQQIQRQPSLYRQQQPTLAQEPSEDDNASQRSYGSMATTRRESSSAYSASSQTTQHQGSFNFVPPAVAGSVRQIPQQYPFVPKSRRQISNLSNISGEEFPSTLTSMESSSSDYADTSDLKKPTGTTADTGTYTCTYHGCTLRFDSPAKLQRHKREGHRNSATIGGGDEGGMTSAAQRNTQAGPHKCERINPSTGKPCNTIFSRPYDLTRHEDTIHNARKLKVHCPLCTEEKTFSRNDALTRHLRVVHPEHSDLSKSRRRAGGGLHD